MLLGGVIGFILDNTIPGKTKITRCTICKGIHKLIKIQKLPMRKRLLQKRITKETLLKMRDIWMANSHSELRKIRRHALMTFHSLLLG